jgi:hypothetical protein
VSSPWRGCALTEAKRIKDSQLTLKARAVATSVGESAAQRSRLTNPVREGFAQRLRFLFAVHMRMIRCSAIELIKIVPAHRFDQLSCIMGMERAEESVAYAGLGGAGEVLVKRRGGFPRPSQPVVLFGMAMCVDDLVACP